MRTALAASALALALATAGLVSCTGPEGPPITPGPEPSGTPAFASDEEALAAAEALYVRYEKLTNAVGRDGWRDTSHYDDVLVGEALAAEVEGAESLAAKGYVQVGDSTHDSLSLQRLGDYGPGTVVMVVYLCSDVSTVDVINGEGESVVAPERPQRQPLEVEMRDDSGEFKIARRDAWTGATFC